MDLKFKTKQMKHWLKNKKIGPMIIAYGQLPGYGRMFRVQRYIGLRICLFDMYLNVTVNLLGWYKYELRKRKLIYPTDGFNFDFNEEDNNFVL